MACCLALYAWCQDLWNFIISTFKELSFKGVKFNKKDLLLNIGSRTKIFSKNNIYEISYEETHFFDYYLFMYLNHLVYGNNKIYNKFNFFYNFL